MPKDEKLEQLKEMLTSNLIKKRKAGIEMAEEMLATGVDREQVRSMLEDVAKNDLMITVQEKAQQVIDEDTARHNPRLKQHADYVFGARCPKGHVSYYDKREYCSKQSGVFRRILERDGKELDEVLVRCKTCDEEFSVEVDCEGYK